MASALYGKGRQHFAEGLIHWSASGDTVKVVLNDTGTYNGYSSIDTHEFQNTSANGGSLAGTTHQTINNKSATLGVCNGDNVTFCAVTSTANTTESLIIYVDGSDGVSDYLIAWVEFSTVTPNGGDITIQWDTGSNKIFKL